MTMRTEEYKAFKGCTACSFNETQGRSDGVVCPDCGKFLDVILSFKVMSENGVQTFEPTAFNKAIG